MVFWPFYRLPLPTFQVDKSGRLQHVNEDWLTLLELKPDDMRGRRLMDFMAPASRQEFLTVFQQSIFPAKNIRSQFVTGTGAITDVLISFSPATNDGRNIGSVVGTLVDLTNLRQTEQSAKGMQALLNSVITNASDAILVTEAEPIDGPEHPRILYVNPAFTTMTGYSSDEICGLTPRILQGPKTDRRELDRLRQALEAWVPIRAELINYTKSGSEFNVEIDINPVADETGHFTHWVSIQRDISIRRKREEDRLRVLIERVPQLMWRSSEVGEWVWASKQWLDYTGQNADQILGWGWLSAVHPEDHCAAREAWKAARPNGCLNVEFRVRCAASHAFVWHHTRSVPILSKGRITEWLGTTSDIQALKTLQQGQQLLLDELQHRARNLLAVVQAISDDTLMNCGSLEQFGDEFRGRLGALSRVQGLLALTGSETIDLRQLVEAEILAHAGADTNNIKIEGPPAGLATAAVQVFALALHELSTNAVKYGALGQPTGHLSVTWTIEYDHEKRPLVALEWRESGVRMPEAGDLARKGYGSELICEALPYHLNATTRLIFCDDGISCSIRFPIYGRQVD